MAVQSKQALIDRADLVARAEEQAEIASEWRLLSQRATREQLLSLPTVASAMAYAADVQAAACERWALSAEEEDDPLLARSLRSLAEDFRVVSGHAAVVEAEATGFAEVDSGEQ